MSRLFTSAVAAAALVATAAGNALVDGGGSVTVTSGPTECSESEKVKEGDHLEMHYTGTIDGSSKAGTPGQKFDSSHDHGSTFAFAIGEGAVIDGWDKGLLGLCKGAHATLVIPPEMGYGEEGAGEDIPGGATLNFAVEVVSVGEAPEGDIDAGEDVPPLDMDELDEHDMGEEYEDPYKDSWWFEAHDKEMQTTHDDEDGEWKPGPISLMMDDFHAYTDAIRTAHEGPEKEAELLAKVKAQYPDIEWDKDAGPVDEHIPEDDEQQYDESTVDRIHGHLDHAFYSPKDKAVADALLKFLDTLAPGAAAAAAAESARVAAMSEEEYAKEFPEEPMEGDLEGGEGWAEEYEGADEGEHSEEL